MEASSEIVKACSVIFVDACLSTLLDALFRVQNIFQEEPRILHRLITASILTKWT